MKEILIQEGDINSWLDEDHMGPKILDHEIHLTRDQVERLLIHLATGLGALRNNEGITDKLLNALEEFTQYPEAEDR